MTENSPKPPRCIFAMSELIILAAIISTLLAVIIPAVEAARDMKGRPLSYPWLQPWYDGHVWIFIAVCVLTATATTALLIWSVRPIVPQWIRRHFPWRAPPVVRAPPREPPPYNPLAARIAATFAGTASALLIVAAAHVRSDRSRQRTPIVTWEGPLADYVLVLAISGWIVSVLAMVIGQYSINKFRIDYDYWAVLGFGLGIMNFCGTLLTLAAIYED